MQCIGCYAQWSFKLSNYTAILIYIGFIV